MLKSLRSSEALLGKLIADNKQLKPSWASTLLCFSVAFEKANEIEGDLIEESRLFNKPWFVFQVCLVALKLSLREFIKAPFVALTLSIASLASSSALTTFLLFPLVFQFTELSTLMMLFVVCLFRSIACFMVGAVLIEYARLLGGRTIIISVLLMLLTLFSGLFIQAWGAFGDVFLGTVFLEPTFLTQTLTLSLYTLCSVIAIMLGGIYSQRAKQKSLAILGCVRIAPLSLDC